MKEYRIIGKRFPRLDAKEKVTGKATYSGDIMLPMMLYAKVLRSPYPHARIIHIDTGRAEQIPGVKAVLTAKDVFYNMHGDERQDEPILAGDEVRYVGDEVAAVAATDEALAEEALNLISVEYEELPALFDPEEAMQPGAPKIRDDVDNNTAYDITIARGDIEKGFREADVIIEEEFTTQSVVHSQIEPKACVASWDANSKLTVWVGSMWPAGLRAYLAMVLGLPPSKIRVINCCVGGAFGDRSRTLRPYVACALLARKTGRPVRIVNTREEEYMTSLYRSGTKIRMKLGAKKDGTITAEHVKVIADSGAYTCINGGILVAIPLRSDVVYRFTNVKWELKMAYTNNGTTSCFRGFGNAQPTFVRESMMDILAEKLGMDTAELKLKNAIRTGDVTVHGWPINSCGLSECIQKTVESTGWKEKRANKQFGRGIGMASMAHESDMRVSNGFAGTTAFVRIGEDGRINVMTGEAEYGQGGDTSCAMVAAEELGVPLNMVSVTPIDTDISPYGLGPWGSKLLITETSATRKAALDAKRQLFEIASVALKAKDQLPVAIKDLEIVDQRIRVISFPERSVSIADVARAAIYDRGGSTIIGKGIDERNTESTMSPNHPTHYGPAVSACYFDNVVAEVEVNTETGEVKVLNLTVADDCGKAINLMGLEGQIQGATAMGIGWTFLESRVPYKGRVLNPSLLDYKVPTALDVSPPDIIIVESMEPGGAYGAKGGGENAGFDSTAPAIANAIYNAIGVRIKNLPITPEKIVKALEGKRNERIRIL